MIIDDKGRLFGKLNIIDLCVAVVVVCALVFAGSKLLSRPAGAPSGLEDYVMKFYVEEWPDYSIGVVQVGDKVEDEQKSIDLGTITNIETDEGYMYNPNADGMLVKSAKEGYKSCEITSELKAQTFANGIIVDGNKFSVGHTLVIRAGKAKIYLKVSGIERKGEAQ